MAVTCVTLLYALLSHCCIHCYCVSIDLLSSLVPARIFMLTAVAVIRVMFLSSYNAINFQAVDPAKMNGTDRGV